MHSLDNDIASLLHNRMREAGIALKLNADVIGFTENDREILYHFQEQKKTKQEQASSTSLQIW